MFNAVSGTIALAIPLRWHLCISNYTIWIRSYNCPRNRAILATILAISTFCPLCSQSILCYLYLDFLIDGFNLVTLYLHCRPALGNTSLFIWRSLCSYITLVAVHFQWSCELTVNAYGQTGIWTYTKQVQVLESIFCCNGPCDPNNWWWYVIMFPNLICWFCVEIFKLLWPFEFMFSITIARSFLPCWLHSCLAQLSLIVYGFLSPPFTIADLNMIWWLVGYLWTISQWIWSVQTIRSCIIEPYRPRWYWWCLPSSPNNRAVGQILHKR